VVEEVEEEEEEESRSSALFRRLAEAIDPDADKTGPMMWVGVGLLFVSLSFDGATGAYEDEIMLAGHLGPFELMYNIQFGKMVIAFLCLLFFNEVNFFFNLVYETGFLLLALGLSGAMLQIFIFVTIAKFGALTCALFGIARKITTLIVSILFFGHKLNAVQTGGLAISIAAMVYNFAQRAGPKGKKKKPPPPVDEDAAEKKTLLDDSGEACGDEDEDDAFPEASKK
jgi:solute carrier family 35 (UDP-galactose transporter), member B1